MTKKTDLTFQNAKRMPRRFFARHMFPGVCGYDDEVVLVDNDAMKRMMPTMEGVPIYVGHRPVDMDKLQAEADGFVVRCFYNELDGWLWAECLAVSDEAQLALDNGWSVSNAYAPTEWGNGGKFHNVDYHRKVVNGEFRHLALVENPRYEEADTFMPDEYTAYNERKTNELQQLQNSLETETKTPGAKMLNIFKMKREAVKEIDADTMVEIQNSKGETVSVSLQEMINAVKKNDEDEAAAAAAAEKAKKEADEKDNEQEDEAEKMNEDTEVIVGGQTMPLKDLVGKFNAMQKKNAKKTKKNEDDFGDEDDKGDADDKEKENESDDEDDKDKKDKENSKAKHFDTLNNAHNRKNVLPSIDTSIDQLARGQAYYGSKKA